MSIALTGIRLGIIGGDDRELYLIPQLQQLGAYIVGVGFEKASSIPGMVQVPSLLDLIGGVDILLFPMFGTDERGVVKAKNSDSPIVLNKEVLQAIPVRMPVFIGWAQPALKSAADKIPSVEGAIHMVGYFGD